MSKLLKIDDVTAKVRQSRAWVYEKTKRKRFPAPIHIDGSRISRWVESDVDQWIAEQVAATRAREATNG